MIKIWNKKDAINGVDADKVMESSGIKMEDEIFLIVNDVTNKVQEIQDKLTITSIYNIDPKLTTLEVGEEYLKIREEQNKRQEDEKVSEIDEMQLKQEEQEKIIADLAYELMLLKGAK